MEFTKYYEKLMLLYPTKKDIWSNDAIDKRYQELKHGQVRDHMMVTINWKPNTTPEDTIRILQNVLSKKWINKYKIAYEQRGESKEECGKGYHNHILLYDVGDKPASHAQREIYNTCKSLVGTKSHIHIDKLPSSWLADKEDYLDGKKWDKDKEQKTIIDVDFRELYSSTIELL